MSNTHKGNVSYREMVKKHKDRYLRATKKQKPEIASEIVEKIRNLTPKGRFLKKIDHAHGEYIDIGDAKAKEKTCQALREGASQNRKKIIIGSIMGENMENCDQKKNDAGKVEAESDLSAKKLDAPALTFETRLKQLKDFKEKHGHLEVTRSLDEELYDYCQNLRKLSYNPKSTNNMIVTGEIVKKLDELGFDWEQKPNELPNKIHGNESPPQAVVGGQQAAGERKRKLSGCDLITQENGGHETPTTKRKLVAEGMKEGEVIVKEKQLQNDTSPENCLMGEIIVKSVAL